MCLGYMAQVLGPCRQALSPRPCIDSPPCIPSRGGAARQRQEPPAGGCRPRSPGGAPPWPTAAAQPARASHSAGAGSSPPSAYPCGIGQRGGVTHIQEDDVGYLPHILGRGRGEVGEGGGTGGAWWHTFSQRTLPSLLPRPQFLL